MSNQKSKLSECCGFCLECPDYPETGGHNYCHNKSCKCHVPAEVEEKTYAKDYSHTHCWNQGSQPACGQKLENHKQCCLCDKKAPEVEECQNCKGFPDGDYGSCGDCKRMIAASRLLKLHARNEEIMAWCRERNQVDAMNDFEAGYNSALDSIIRFITEK